MSTKCRIKCEVSIAWWVPIYIETLVIFCNTFGLEPDIEKLNRIIAIGTKVRIANDRRSD